MGGRHARRATCLPSCLPPAYMAKQHGMAQTTNVALVRAAITHIRTAISRCTLITARSLSSVLCLNDGDGGRGERILSRHWRHGDHLLRTTTYWMPSPYRDAASISFYTAGVRRAGGMAQQASLCRRLAVKQALSGAVYRRLTISPTQQLAYLLTFSMFRTSSTYQHVIRVLPYTAIDAPPTAYRSRSRASLLSALSAITCTQRVYCWAARLDRRVLA